VPPNLLARWEHPQQQSRSFSRVRQFWQHLFGVLATAGLLTLGAPFWFNLLKNLMVCDRRLVDDGAEIVELISVRGSAMSFQQDALERRRFYSLIAKAIP